MMRTLLCGTIALSLLTLVAERAEAQEHAVSFGAGYFALRGEDARTGGDVLLHNLQDLDFAIGDFSKAALEGDWLVGIGDYLEAGVGLGFYRRTVPSFYRGFVNADGSEIEQELRLRIIPVTTTARFLPLGRHATVQPYVGAGLAFLRWRYSEVGEFVDFRDGHIFRDRFVAEGRETVPVLLGGARVPLGARLAAGGEIRFNRGSGRLEPGAGFLGDEIDLGGLTSAVTLVVRF